MGAHRTSSRRVPERKCRPRYVGDAVEGLDVAFSRAVSGRPSDYAWSAVTDAAGLLSLTISSENGVSGYYRARATNADGKTLGQWQQYSPQRQGNAVRCWN